MSFGITRDLANDELVMILRSSRGTKVDRGDELETNDANHHDRQCKKDVGREQALGRVTVVNLANQEQVTEACALPVEDVRGNVQCVDLLRQVLARVELEDVD